MSQRTWQPGDVVLGLYEVRDVLQGGMGVVHRVRHRGWRIDLAVKTPRPELLGSAEAVRRFEAEAGTWVELGLHPHTVNCVYVRTVDGLPRVFAEWVDGGSLAEAVSGGRLYAGGPRATLGRLLDVSVQTAWGLRHAHGSELVHQDVKPANVLLDPDGTAKVTDFGLAAARSVAEDGPTGPPGVTYRGMTPAYCSPEQAGAAVGGQGVRLTPATDVWSWALTVLEMFAGRRPTRYGQAAAEALEAFLEAGTADPRVPPMPPALAGLLRQCFVGVPGARPALDEAAAVLVSLYGDLMGEPFPRPAPEASRLLADELSNQALSLLDLGRTEEAEERWQRAVTADPHHLVARYNQGLHLWRRAETTDRELLRALEAARDVGGETALAARLLGFVHLERDDRAQAAALLRGAAEEQAEDEPVPDELREALTVLAERPQVPTTLLGGHLVAVSAVAFSDDGEWLLSGDSTGSLRLWERAGGRCVRELTRAGDMVRAVALSGDASIGLVARYEGLPEVWDLARGERLPLPPDFPSGEVTAVALNGDGSFAAIGHADGTVHRWQVQARALLDGFGQHRYGSEALVLSRNNARAYSVGGMREPAVHVWDLVTRGHAELTVPPDVPDQLRWGPMIKAALAPDGRSAVQIWLGAMVSWDLVTGRITAQAPHDLVTVSALALAPGGNLAIVDDGATLQVRETATGRVLRTIGEGHDWSRLAASGDGRFVAVGRLGDGEREGEAAVRVEPLPVLGYRAPWAYARPRPAAELALRAARFAAALEEGRQHVAQGRYGQAAQCLRRARSVPGFSRHPEVLDTWELLGRHGRRTGLRGVWPTFDFHEPYTLDRPVMAQFIGDSDTFITPIWTQGLGLLDAARPGPIRVVEGLRGSARAVLTPDFPMAILIGDHGDVALYDLDTGSFVPAVQVEDTTAIAVAATSGRLLMGGKDGGVAFLDFVQEAEDQTVSMKGSALPALDGEVRAVAISADGRFAASAALADPDPGQAAPRTRTLRGWDLATESCVWEHVDQARGFLQFLQFSPDGRTLVHVGGEQVRAFDAATGRALWSLTLENPTAEPVIAVGARRGVVADGTDMVVFDPATGRVATRLRGPARIYSLVLTTDERFAVTGGDEVRVWDLDTGQMVWITPGKSSGALALAMSTSGRRLVALGLETFRIWELDWEFAFTPDESDTQQHPPAEGPSSTR
ncbi:protein kinase [Streptomyces olivaceoviridis]|uniref:protein kinase domain-containing protein n=1 Tax=Streptomyces olivaceoviridis TaxID=1921 RepID=UPI0036B8BC90